MPALPPAASVLKVEFIQDYQGVPVANILHYGYDGGPPSGANLNTFAATCATKWHADIHPEQSSQLHLEEVVVTDLSSDTSATGTAPGGTAGAIGTATLAASSCVVAKFKVARRYRGGHPRMYLSGIVQANLEDVHHLSNSAFADWGNAIDLLLSDITSAGCPGTSGVHAVSLSYFHDKVLRTTPVADDIIEVTVNRRLGSQRRRLGPA